MKTENQKKHKTPPLKDCGPRKNIVSAAPKPAETEARAPGRPRSEGLTLPIYTSMSQCSAATGIPESLLKQSKKLCPHAFTWNRVNFETFLRWFFTEGLKTADWTSLREKHQGLNEQLKYRRAADLVIEKAPVAKGIHAAEAQFFGALDRLFLSELPPLLANKAAGEIHKQSVEKIEELKTILRSSLATALGAVSKGKSK